MSLLTSGPHSVTVTPMERVQDVDGTTVRPGAPVPVRGVSVQPISATEAQGLGLSVLSTYTVIGAGVWPGGPYSQVTIDAGPPEIVGETLQQQGRPRGYAMSRRTAHFEVTLSTEFAEVH
ncbi:hypothetical protein [Brachybacterium kimchii]|uniref:Uncharacterized protein n=1 Tax=Brachybacterium kimchii TaxID=2942909 RepID=A0ABY4N7X1_9MICO|nr:hypothetical protein [Brachybacterium kimchii]UQN30658.1 hypothetical protein M4486_04975 [Brachybacterium kimchii]